MDHWYLDLKKNLIVKLIFNFSIINFVLFFSRLNLINYDYNFSKKLNKILYVKNKRKPKYFLTKQKNIHLSHLVKLKNIYV
jgi:hypothetical protein